MSTFRVGFVQGRPVFGAGERNLEHGLALARTVDAELVILPELWSSGYVFSSHAEVASLAEDARRGRTAVALTAAARRDRRHYIAGFPEASRGRFYNSAMLVGPRSVIGVYRKLHLFEREREWFSPGNLPLEVHRVGRARVGMLICFDWRSRRRRVVAARGRRCHRAPFQPGARTRGASACARSRTVFTAPRTAPAAPGGRAAPASPAVDRRQRWFVLAADGGPRQDDRRARDKRLTSVTPIFANRRPEHYRRLVRR